MSEAGTIIGAVFGAFFGVVFLYGIYKSINVVREKEAVVIERFGKFKEVLTPGVHFIIPYVDWPKTYSFSYYISNAMGKVELVRKKNHIKISLQNEVLDFLKQQVITRDNALISLDALLNYKIINPKVMMYNTQNLPRMISMVLQAQLRNVAGSLDVDTLIESTAGLNRVGAEMKVIATRWGVHIEFVKIQRVEAGDLSRDLEMKKNADLKNKEVLITAKAEKQTTVITAEGHRDRMIREAEGEASAVRARARGEAKAITNQARAEADAVKEIARAIKRSGENPTKYLLALKYIDALRFVGSKPSTEIRFLPRQTSFLQTVQAFGLNTVHPPQGAR